MLAGLQISFLVLHILLCDLDGLMKSEMPLKDDNCFKYHD